MRRRGKLAPLLFRAVCLGFSALLLVLTLLTQTRVVRTQSRIEALETAIEQAENEKTRLKIRRAEALSLAELERRAVQELGMQHPEPGQIITIPYLG